MNGLKFMKGFSRGRGRDLWRRLMKHCESVGCSKINLNGKGVK